MTRSAPATAKTPSPSEPADRSGRLLHVLLSSAGLSMRDDVERPPAKAEPKQRPRRRRAPSSNR